jgi:hypothetical protein
LTELAAAASARTGSSDFGSPHHRAVFEAWAADLGGPTLNDQGQTFYRRLAEENLSRRLQILAFLKEHPEIEAVPVPHIILIAGLPRSGTTLLHNLMHRHPNARSLLRWELMRPLPPPEASTYETDPRIAKVQASIEPLRGGALERMHWVEAIDPEECTWGWYDGTGLFGRSCIGTMPTWWDVVRTTDAGETFREYRSLIKLLLWHNPLPPEGVLVLKNPMACAQLGAFAAEFPDAKIVMTHRDPWRVLTSSCSVTESIQTPFVSASYGEQMRNDGRNGKTLEFLGDSAAALVQLAQELPERIVHVRYEDLMHDPVATTVCAFESHGAACGEPYRDTIAGFLAEQRAGKRVAPPDRYSDYGYNESSVRADARLTSYCSSFDVTPEAARVTAPTER